MSRLQWDQDGDRGYRVGIHKVALFKSDTSAASGYGVGVAWNGVTKVGEAPEGAEATDLWANDSKYGTLRSSEQFKGSIEAYDCPEEFDECDGCVEAGSGFLLRQQTRKPFGLVWCTSIGNDTEGVDHGEELHIAYNATASPSSVDRETINDSPNVPTMSWEFSTTPVNVEGYKPTSHVVFRSTKMTAQNWNRLLDTVFGSSDADPTLPTLATLISTYGTVHTYEPLDEAPTDWATAYYTKYYTKYGTTYTLIPRQDSAPTFVANQYYEETTT